VLHPARDSPLQDIDVIELVQWRAISMVRMLEHAKYEEDLRDTGFVQTREDLGRPYCCLQVPSGMV